jgi:hypothetical protein
MLTPFEAGKTAEELGIDTTRKFVLMHDMQFHSTPTEGGRHSIQLPRNYPKGTYVTAVYVNPKWECATFYPTCSPREKSVCIFWSDLAYAPQSDVSPEKHALREGIDPLQVATGTIITTTEEYTPQVGDIISVRVEGRVAEVVTKDNVYKVSLWGGGFLWLDTRQTSEEATLISRKAKRTTVTKEEADKMERLLDEYKALPLEIGKRHPSLYEFLLSRIEGEDVEIV